MNKWIHAVSIWVIVLLACYIYEKQNVKVYEPVEKSTKRCITSKYTPNKFESAVKRTD